MATAQALFYRGQGRIYFAAVALVYCSLALLLARWNVTAHQQPIDVRFAFALLALAAFGGFWFALAGSAYLQPRSLYRHVGLFVLAFAGVFFSSLLWMFLAVNIYGE